MRERKERRTRDKREEPEKERKENEGRGRVAISQFKFCTKFADQKMTDHKIAAAGK